MNNQHISDSESIQDPRETLISIDRSQLLNWQINKKSQESFYKNNHKKHPNNIYLQNGTSQRIHYKEIQFLEEQLLKVLGKEACIRRKTVLNIPSGSGRLNQVLQKFYGQITCVDACSQALINIKKKPTDVEIKRELSYLQNYHFRNKYDLVFCNYGVSYLNLKQLHKFLAKVKDGIKKEGLLIIKEVYLADEQEEAFYSETQKRIFITEEQYRDVISQLNKHFEILTNIEFEPSRYMLPEKFLILKRK